MGFVVGRAADPRQSACYDPLNLETLEWYLFSSSSLTRFGAGFSFPLQVAGACGRRGNVRRLGPVGPPHQWRSRGRRRRIAHLHRHHEWVETTASGRGLAICQANHTNIEGEEWEKLYCKSVEVCWAFDIRQPSTSRKAKTLSKRREARANGNKYYDPAHTTSKRRAPSGKVIMCTKD